MAELFCNSRKTGFLLGVVLAFLMVQRIGGYPYQWQDFLSYDNVKAPSTDQDSTDDGAFDRLMFKDYGRAMSASGQNNQYASLLSYAGKNDVPPIIDKSLDKQISTFDSDEDVDSSDEIIVDDDYKGNTDTSEAASEEINIQIIKKALHEAILLSPAKLAPTLSNKPFDISYEEGMSPKIQKPRSLSDSPSTITQIRNSSGNDKIVFPDDVPNKKSDDVVRMPVPSCENSTFCLNPPYYLSDSEIDNALNQRFLEPITEPPVIGQRIGPVEEDNGLCISTEQIIQPKTGLDDSNQWVYILNNKKYTQTVRVEICLQRDAACRIIDDVPLGYKTSCKQKYIYRQLVAMESNETKVTNFQIPSSCCCHIKFTGDPMTRMGINLSKHKQQSPINENDD